jgi:peptidoglycan/LPS O-acetylase OafA/YrhL
MPFLAATLLLLWLSHEMAGITLAGVCSQVFYYQNYFFHPGIIPELGPLWSLAVEEHFYLFFPALDGSAPRTIEELYRGYNDESSVGALRRDPSCGGVV